MERDDGWIGVSRGAAMYFAPFEAWGPHQRRLLRLCRGRVLDVGCRAGRACLALQDRGHAVVGGRRRTPWFDYLMLSPAELARTVDGSGWRVERLLPGPGPRYGVVLEKNG